MFEGGVHLKHLDKSRFSTENGGVSDGSYFTCKVPFEGWVEIDREGLFFSCDARSVYQSIHVSIWGGRVV